MPYQKNFEKYRVSRQLVLNFNFNYWFFWLSYQKNLICNKKTKWFNLDFATLIAADKPCPQLQPSLVALTRKIKKVIEKILNCSINLMHFEISQDFFS